MADQILRDDPLEDDEDDVVALESQEEEGGESEVEAAEPDGSVDAEEAEAETDDEREQIRERRRQERRHKKQAQREREDTLRRELASRDAIIQELRSRVDVIDRRAASNDLAAVQAEKTKAAQAYKYFKDQIAEGTRTADGPLVADATEKLLVAQNRFNELDQIEKAYQKKQQQPAPLDPRLVSFAKSWADRNSWYDPSGKDADSRIVLTLDHQLAEDGWNPTTEEYWKELDKRVAKYLPHRNNSGKVTTKPRSVVAGSGKDASMGGTSQGSGYKLSAERVKALKDAGVWNDPKQRAAYIKSFRDYDKQNGVQ